MKRGTAQKFCDALHAPTTQKDSYCIKLNIAINKSGINIVSTQKQKTLDQHDRNVINCVGIVF